MPFFFFLHEFFRIHAYVHFALGPFFPPPFLPAAKPTGHRTVRVVVVVVVVVVGGGTTLRSRP